MTRRRVWHAGLVLVALVAVLAAYATASLEPEPDGVVAGEAENGPVTLAGFYGREPGPDGLGWRWMGTKAAMVFAADGRRWLAFRAESLKQRRTLRIGTRDRDLAPVRVGTRPQAHLLGPIKVVGKLPLLLSAVPGAVDPGHGDSRRLAVFLSQLQLVDEPAVALPGRGFYSPEHTPEGEPFNWMRSTATIDVVVRSPDVDRVWLTARVGTPDGQRRSLILRGGGVRRRVELGGSGSAIEVGPFPVRRGRVRVRLLAVPGGVRVAGDDRRLALRISGIGVKLPPDATG